MLAQKSSDPKTTHPDEDLPLAQDLEVLHTTAFKRKRKWRAVRSVWCVCVCVCVLLALNQSPSQPTLIFPKTPLIAVHDLRSLYVFRNGTISDIKKDTTHINGPSLSVDGEI